MNWRRLIRWSVKLVIAGILLAWILSWALDSPDRPELVSNDLIVEPSANGTGTDSPDRPNLVNNDIIVASSVYITGMACGQTKKGSGFVAEPGLVLTNAHVVAGVENISVGTFDGAIASGVLVGFDPERDIAAIEVSGLTASPVQFSSENAVADDVGEVVVVEEEGSKSFVPYSVVRRVRDEGKDIYGEDIESRIALEIRSDLDLGDSGAALVNEDSELVGVVFAISRREKGLGYALARVEVSEFLTEIKPISPVPTPACL